MRSTAWLVAVGMAISWLGPAGCRPNGSSPTARPDHGHAGTGDPAPPATQASPSDDSTPEVVGAGGPTSSTPTKADARAPRSTTDRLWIAYDATKGDPARVEALDELLQQYLDEHPDDPEALLLRADIRIQQDRLDEALAAAERCLEVSPETAGCWLAVGVLAETRGSVEHAIEAYRRYIELAPDGRYAPDARKAVERLRRDLEADHPDPPKHRAQDARRAPAIGRAPSPAVGKAWLASRGPAR